METPSKPTVAKAIASISRVPLLLLICGLVNYGLLRLLAPSVDPADLSNIIGLSAILEAGAIEAVLRRLNRNKEVQANEN